MGYAFISYSTKNQDKADAIHNLLKKKNINTWMAPGDIPVGTKYAQVINKAIKDCSCFILVLSNDSQESIWVPKEVERAIHYRRIVIPVQIEDMVLNDEFELYISNDHIAIIKSIDEGSEEVIKFIQSVRAATKETDRVDLVKNSEKNTMFSGTEMANAFSKGDLDNQPEFVKIGKFYQKPGDVYDPVSWIVLCKDKEKVLLISKYGIETKEFSERRNCTWDNSTLCQWLNDSFYKNAFAEEERMAIVDTIVEPDINENYSTHAGKPISNKIFILSKTEVNRYFVEDGIKDSLKCVPTEYAIQRGCFVYSENKYCLWWLRTPGSGDNLMTFVNAGGSISTKGCYAQRGEVCVRPAMWIEYSYYDKLERELK